MERKLMLISPKKNSLLKINQLSSTAKKIVTAFQVIKCFQKDRNYKIIKMSSSNFITHFGGVKREMNYSMFSLLDSCTRVQNQE